MKKPKIWFCEVWSYNVVFFIGWSRQDFESGFRKRYGTAVPGPANREGTTLDSPELATVVLWTRSTKASVIAHECLHAANFILKSAGHKIDTENDEAQAYLLDALVKKATT